MGVKEFTVGCSKTINMGNFSSIKVEAAITMAVNEGETYAQLRKDAQALVKEQLEETYRTNLKKKEPAKDE